MTITDDHWKPAKMTGLLLISLSFLIFQLEGCHGQDNSNNGAVAGGSNFFYYFSPTQRTQVNQASTATPGNIFSSPLFNQQQHSQESLHPTFSSFLQQQPPFQFSTPASSLLGYQQQTPAFTTQQPIGLGQLQQFQQFAQQQQQAPSQHIFQPNSGYSTFSRLGHNLFSAQNLIAQQQAQAQAYLAGTVASQAAPTLAPPLQNHHHQHLQTTSEPVPGSLSFYESPFQYLQQRQRLLQTAPTPSIPAPAPEGPLAVPTTAAPPLSNTNPTDSLTQNGRRKQKLSARYRNYPIAPQLYYQFSPQQYSTSTLPFTEERYYSTAVPSAATPTGYSFSLGAGGPTTSSVHVSMGPLTKNIQQHLTEITHLNRRLSQSQSKPIMYADQVAVDNVKDPIRNAFSAVSAEIMAQDSPLMQVTSEIVNAAAAGLTELPSPAPTLMPMPMQMSMSTLENMTVPTMDTLLNEPSFQMETIAQRADPTIAPSSMPSMFDSADEIVPIAAEKISEAGIPRRLTIRKKVARKRLGLGEPEALQGRSVDGTMVIINGERRRIQGRRRLSLNRLSINEPAKQYEGSQKGEIPENKSTVTSAPTSQTPAPVEATPQAEIEVSSVPSSTTPQPSSEHPETDLRQPPASSPQEENNPAPAFSNEQTLNDQKQQPSAEEVLPTTTTIEPIPASPLPTTSTTTTTPLPEIEVSPPKQIQEEESPFAPKLDAEPKQYDEEYYEEYEDVPQKPEPNVNALRNESPSANSDAQPNPQSDSSNSNESGSSASAELPVLDGVQKEDFPSVFRDQSLEVEKDNSLEISQGDGIRHKISQPAINPEKESDEVIVPTSATEAPVPTSATSSSSTTAVPSSSTEYNAAQTLFVNEDPPEEQPPPGTEEIHEPVLNLLSTTEQPPTTLSTTTSSPPMLSTVSSIPAYARGFPSMSLSSEEGYDDDDEHEYDNLSLEDQPNQPEPSSSTTDPPTEHVEDPQLISSTEATPAEAMEPLQPQQEDIVEVKSNLNEPSVGSNEAGSSSTTEESIMQLEDERGDLSSSTEPSTVSSSTSSTTPLPVVEEEKVAELDSNEVNEEAPSSSTTVTPLPSPVTTESAIVESVSKEENELPLQQQFLENLSEENPQSKEEDLENHSAEGDKLSSDEVIGKAQRLALEETLKRLREQRQQTSTETVDTNLEEETSANSTSSSSPNSEPRGRLRNFVRRPLQLSNLPLPTAAPVPISNAVLDDGEGEHQSRSQVIQKIQRFRANYKRPTTTKRPRRVTRPSSSTERLPLALLPQELDSFSESSSTAGPLETVPTSISPLSRSRFRTTPTTTTTFTNAPNFAVVTTEAPSSSTSTEAFTTVEPATITTTTSSTTPASTDFLTTTTIARRRYQSRRQSTTTTMTSTTPSTTTMITTEIDFYENDSNRDSNDQEGDHVYYDEVANTTLSTEPSSTTSRSSTEGIEAFQRYTTPPSSTTTTTTTSTEKGPYMTTMTDVEFREVAVEDSSTESSFSDDASSTTTTSTTTTENPMGTTTSAGQLIIHEILPTMPPLKEVSFVIGESIEDQDQDQVLHVSQSHENDKQVEQIQAVVRVEAKVSVADEEKAQSASSSSSQQEDDYSSSGSGQLISSEDGSNEGITGEGRIPSLSTTPGSLQVPGEVSSSMEERNGRKVRVVIRRQKSRNNNNNKGEGQQDDSNRRRRRKILHKQIRRRL